MIQHGVMKLLSFVKSHKLYELIDKHGSIIVMETSLMDGIVDVVAIVLVINGNQNLVFVIVIRRKCNITNDLLGEVGLIY